MDGIDEKDARIQGARTMSDFPYAVVSSVLHDLKAVDALFSAFEPFFAGLGGHRVELAGPDAGQGPGVGSVIAAATPPFFFILTGGTEGIVLDYLTSLPGHPSGRPFPLVLIAHTRHNSLPAALEIAARARQDGGSAILVQVRSPGDASARSDLLEAIHLCRTIGAMRGTRIGAVGEPSDWLVASSQKSVAASSTWGTLIESIPFSELRTKIGMLRATDGLEVLDTPSMAFLENSGYRKEAADSDMYKSDTIYRALRQVIGERRLDGLTLRCFDLVTLDRSTGCFALSQLADDGVDAGCEGDIPSILALRWMRLLSGKPAWMANPSEISPGEGEERGRILLAHCTVPRSLLVGYGIRNHFESGLGLAVAGRFPPGPVTLVRIGGASLDKTWIAEGFLASSPSDEGLCRTQAVVELYNADLMKLLEAPLGNHIVVGFGHVAKLARRYLSLERIGEPRLRKKVGYTKKS
jgi:L-fucose isomerase-like protein